MKVYFLLYGRRECLMPGYNHSEPFAFQIGWETAYSNVKWNSIIQVVNYLKIDWQNVFLSYMPLHQRLGCIWVAFLASVWRQNKMQERAKISIEEKEINLIKGKKINYFIQIFLSIFVTLRWYFPYDTLNIHQTNDIYIGLSKAFFFSYFCIFMVP